MLQNSKIRKTILKISISIRSKKRTYKLEIDKAPARTKENGKSREAKEIVWGNSLRY